MLSDLQVLLLVLVALLFLYYRFRKAASSAASEEEETVNPMLCKFVNHEGSIVGEVVALEEGRMLLKQSGEFKAVDATLAILENDEVTLKGDIDWAAAKAEGATWKEQITKGRDELVTANLTTSEDVKSPALEAFNRRQAELDEEE